MTTATTKKYKLIYVSGALTEVPEEIKKIYEKMVNFLEPYADFTYVPHLNGTDPILNANVNAREVWEKDRDRVNNSDLVIAYVGHPSTGVGAELELARIAKVKTIIWWFKGQRVSRMAKGNPGVTHAIEVENETDFFNKLIEKL